MKPLLSGIAMLLAIASSSTTAVRDTAPLPAPTYYIAVDGRKCEPDSITIMGASNLPSGAVLAIEVENSDPTYITLPVSGWFEKDIHAKGGMSFHAGLTVRAYFQIAYYRGPRQPTNVLRVVGLKGWRLAAVRNPAAHFDQLSGLSHNPQLFQTSGWYYGIQTKVVLSECEALTDSKRR
jgi:hypothetical protein